MDDCEILGGAGEARVKDSLPADVFGEVGRFGHDYPVKFQASGVVDEEDHDGSPREDPAVSQYWLGPTALA
ncbi:MAG: hypothetical protein DLM70_08810 [Chloroflexi bacterium]|nr:MAG: hypothetical protein DLM70_08810 [Chloroflexota bacterium]